MTKAILSSLALAAAAALWSPRAAAQEAELPALRAAAKASPGDPGAALALGKALRRSGHPGEASTELTRGAGLPAAGKSGLVAALRYELARVKIDQRDLRGALSACTALPAGAKALAAACRAEAHLFQNRATEAMPEVAKALEIEPGLYEAKVAEGRALVLTGKVAEAEAALRAAVRAADTRPEAHHHLGQLLVVQGQRDAGLEELRRAASADPADPEIAFHLGEVLGRSKEGRDAFAAAVRIRPSFAAAHAELALASLELGDLATAERAATEAVKLDAALFPAHVALGKVRVLQARWDDALKEGEAAKKLIPNAAAGDLVAADAFAGRGDVDLAVEAYQKAFGLDRTDPTPLVHAARACLAAGRLTTAKGFTDRVTTDFAKWGPGWVEAGELAAKQGDKARARTAWEAALRGEGPVDRDAVRRKIAALK